MALAAGSQLGSHQIIGLLGAGGMGEVYRAHDTKLNRQVAIKVLPAEYARDPERVARFQREAQAVAALNHPGVAAIYEFARADDIGFLVLELVEGETLAERLRRGPVPPEEALAIAKEICDALEAAHEKGICHRDLKPANIKITPDGKVKVLDFGLAKVLHDSSVSGNVANSPTLSLAGTMPGVILGTAGYMSPEQAKGFAADHRSDIFSLGCILYELLTGRVAFEGETASEILAAVLKSEPDYSRLPSGLNLRLIELLRRCLEKQPKQRWHSAGDVRLELDAIAARGVFAREPVAASRSRWRRAWLLAAGALVGAFVTLAVVSGLRQERPQPIWRFTISLPDRQIIPFALNRNVVAISPQGGELIYVAENGLFLRSLDQIEPRRIAGTEGSRPDNLAFSPDGQSIAYWSATDQAIKRIAVSGGAPFIISAVDNPSPYGISWSTQGLLFAHNLGRGIMRVSSNGGTPEVVVAASGDETLGNPQLLPDGRTILYSVAKGTAASRWDLAQVVAHPIGGARKMLLQGGADARYVPSGHLVYAVSGALMAVPFDLARLEVVGPPTPVVEGVRRATYSANPAPTAQYAVSATGSLVYLPGPLNVSNTQSDLAVFSRDGKSVPLKLPPSAYEGPRVSPNGRLVALSTDDGKESVVWVYELNGGSSIRRLTFGGNSRYPLWSADSEWVAFQSDREGDRAIFRQRANGRGEAERLTKPDTRTEHVPYAWTPDGTVLVVGIARDARYSLATLTLPERKFSQWGTLESNVPLQPVLSSDGRWIAYQLGEMGRANVYVQPFPDGGAKYMVPSDLDNHHPAWTPDGKALTYIPRQGVTYIIPVTTDPQLAFGRPDAIDRGGRVEGPAAAHRNHDHIPGTQQLIGVLPGGPQAGGAGGASPPHLVLNWFEDLKRRVPLR